MDKLPWVRFINQNKEYKDKNLLGGPPSDKWRLEIITGANSINFSLQGNTRKTLMEQTVEDD